MDSFMHTFMLTFLFWVLLWIRGLPQNQFVSSKPHYYFCFYAQLGDCDFFKGFLCPFNYNFTIFFFFKTTLFIIITNIFHIHWYFSYPKIWEQESWCHLVEISIENPNLDLMVNRSCGRPWYLACIFSHLPL